MDKNLKHLGKQSQEAVEELDLIEWSSNSETAVQLNATEFTSHCPVTKQPDFGNLKVVYVPDGHLVETKSFKLWLWGYRHKAQFNERIVDEICERFFEQVKPKRVTVIGTFNLRGGIGVTAECTRSK